MRATFRISIASLTATMTAAPLCAQTFDGVIVPEEVVEDAIDTPVMLPPLLLEGMVLTAAPGVLRRYLDSEIWVFHVDGADPELGGYELVLYPCQLLSDMQNVLDLHPGEEVRFELTGEVFAYHNLNFVLPTYAPHIVVEVADLTTDEVTEIVEDDAPPEEGDSVDDIIRRLEQAVGPIVQDPGRADAAQADPGLGDRSFLIWRRGRLVRRNAGGWLFIFDADAEGLSDPPAVVLPCRMRESLETYALGEGGTADVLMSGRLLTYRGTRYILPTVFQEPRERSKLKP